MKAEVEIPDDVIAGTLCSGVEGGLTRCWCVKIRRLDKIPAKLLPTFGDSVSMTYYQIPAGVVWEVTEQYDDEPAVAHRLDAASLARGLKILGEKYPHHLAAIVGESGDAITGDVLIQCATIGDIKYG